MGLVIGSDHHRQLRSKGLRPGSRVTPVDRIVIVPAAPIHAVHEGDTEAVCGYTPRQVFDAQWAGSMWRSGDRCPECVELAPPAG
jgi:hypothetical protein